MGLNPDTSPNTARLRTVLGTPDTGRLVVRIRERLARGLALTGPITLANPTPGERAAVDQLLGRRPSTGRSLTVPLTTLDATLRGSGIFPDGLAAAVEALEGPVAVRAQVAEAEAETWSAVFSPLHEQVSGRADLEAWAENVTTSGLVRRLARTPDDAAPLVARLCAVLRELPTAPEPTARFAARVLGGAHALDEGQPLTTLVFGAARAMSGAPDGVGSGWRRMVWEAVGLLRDELSSTALTLGLSGDDATSTGRALAGWRDDGQPVVLTLRQLLADPPTWCEQTVSVCENRSVVSVAADRLGASCGPLVCVSGQPSAAVLVLLDQLVRAGARLRYHGDFDWYGIRIGNFLRRRVPWEPWHFGHTAYLDAADRYDTHPLKGQPVPASWDSDLSPAMARCERQVEEELVLGRLLEDLRR